LGRVRKFGGVLVLLGEELGEVVGGGEELVVELMMVVY
jgi:hypothetical protein